MKRLLDTTHNEEDVMRGEVGRALLGVFSAVNKLHRKHDLRRLWVRRVYRVTYRGERKVPSCDD